MLSLWSDDASLVLAPEAGGAVVGWCVGRRPLLRRPLPEAILRGDPRGLGCFPLVPFSNRIAHGRFRWDGTKQALARNFGDHPHTIHGVGWQRAWQVVSVGAASATLALRHTPEGDDARSWPFAFAAEQRFELRPDMLTVTLTVQNLHDGPAPAGLGLHPYFPRAGATLRFAATDVWLNGDDALPARAVPVPSEWDHAAGRVVGTVALDNCFAGWDGQARIGWSNGLALQIQASDALRHLIVYTPPGQDFFCVEPVSHLTDAINRVAGLPEHGLHVLAPGAVLQAEVILRITTVR